jgi:hypothetical protein
MLSPNARNVTRDNRGMAGAVTVTVNVHDAVVCTESVAVQRTDVEPTGKIEADAGVQLEVVGGTPPVTPGVPNATVAPVALVAVTD